MNQAKPLAAILLTCRFIAGGGFLLAAFLKLKNPNVFMHSIDAFQIIPESLVPILVPFFAYLVPWSEVIIGLALVYGFWSRAAGVMATTIYAAFTVAILSAIFRGLELKCGCFAGFFGEGGIGMNSVIRNLVFIAASLGVALLGGGAASLDTVFENEGKDIPSP